MASCRGRTWRRASGRRGCPAPAVGADDPVSTARPATWRASRRGSIAAASMDECGAIRRCRARTGRPRCRRRAPPPAPDWRRVASPVPLSPGPRASSGGPGTRQQRPTCGRSPAFIGITGSDGAGSRLGAMVSGVASDWREVTGIVRTLRRPACGRGTVATADTSPPAETSAAVAGEDAEDERADGGCRGRRRRRDRVVDAGETPDARPDECVGRERGAERPAGAVPGLKSNAVWSTDALPR